ncbi:DinB family protein [Rhodocytophaga aerolata]|uniref:DinB family protein n=1 Tax=Rhodocytophaga aerolata TaxID=455078 RepID=A0ABT8RAW7_9BACT|nr:DinB family protein [Rhodocytophaga aerolata]MDO1449205.1 DinB family protein [Rhodocytophaga aerolata]
MIEELRTLYERDIQRLHTEIDSFQQDAHLWQKSGHVPNSAGNLALHLVGNLSTYIGNTLGKQPYVRNREAEFATKNLPKQELLRQIEHTKAVVITSLKALQTEDLAQGYPEEVLGYKMTTGFFLMHLLAHLSYHLGQVNYLRRILE